MWVRMQAELPSFVSGLDDGAVRGYNGPERLGFFLLLFVLLLYIGIGIALLLGIGIALVGLLLGNGKEQDSVTLGLPCLDAKITGSGPLP